MICRPPARCPRAQTRVCLAFCSLPRPERRQLPDAQDRRNFRHAARGCRRAYNPRSIRSCTCRQPHLPAGRRCRRAFRRPASAPAVAAAPATVANAKALAAMPPLAPQFRRAGRKIRAEALTGSADALSLAQLALACAAERRLLAIAVAASARRAAPGRGDIRWFAPRPACRPVPRLGNAALRPVLAASGPGLGAARHALPRLARRMRRAGGRRHDRTLPARAASLPGGVHLLPEAG